MYIFPKATVLHGIQTGANPVGKWKWGGQGPCLLPLHNKELI